MSEPFVKNVKTIPFLSKTIRQICSLLLNGLFLLFQFRGKPKERHQDNEM